VIRSLNPRRLSCQDGPPRRDTVIVTSANVAVREARQSGQNYVLASSLVSSRAVYVLAASHPRLVSHPQMTIRYEFTPSGQVIPVSPFQIKQAGKGRQN
jgi:hypothetical protein